MCVCAYTRAWSHFTCVWLFATLWTLAHQAPLSKGFSRQEYWSGLPCPPLKHLPNPGIKPVSLLSPALAGGFSSALKNPSASVGDMGSIPGWGRSPGGGNGNPLQYSSMKNPWITQFNTMLVEKLESYCDTTLKKDQFEMLVKWIMLMTE